MSLTASFRNMQLPDRQCRDRQDMKDIKRKGRRDCRDRRSDENPWQASAFFLYNHFIGRNSADYMKNLLLTNKKK